MTLICFGPANKGFKQDYQSDNAIAYREAVESPRGWVGHTAGKPAHPPGNANH